MINILELYLNKKIKSYRFHQIVEVYPKQCRDKEIYETEVETYEPGYQCFLETGEPVIVSLSDLIQFLFEKQKVS